MRLSPDYRLCTAGSAVLPGCCLASAIWPEIEDFIGYGLIGGTVLATATWWVRRERRIRRRRTEIQPMTTCVIPTGNIDPPSFGRNSTDAVISGVSMTKVA